MSEIDESLRKEMQLKALLRQCLENDAYERLMNVRLANEELYLTSSEVVIANSRRLGRKLNDAEMLTILRRLKGPKQSGSINIRRR
ncbi:MAG: DNA-binding protein [Candidatus Anstonellales archaeon]